MLWGTQDPNELVVRISGKGPKIAPGLAVDCGTDGTNGEIFIINLT